MVGEVVSRVALVEASVSWGRFVGTALLIDGDSGSICCFS